MVAADGRLHRGEYPIRSGNRKAREHVVGCAAMQRPHRIVDAAGTSRPSRAARTLVIAIAT
jgi:hypothetical protein